MKKLFIVCLALILMSSMCAKNEITDALDDLESKYPGITGNQNNSTSSNWYSGRWKKNGENVYLDLSGSTPIFCPLNLASGQTATFSTIRWDDASNTVGYFDLNQTYQGQYRTSTFQIKKSGSYLILSPWDSQTQSTHDPVTYTATTAWCN